MAAKLFSSVCTLVNLLLTIRPSIKETTLLSSRNATREDFALVIELMRSNKIHENLMKTVRSISLVLAKITSVTL